MSASKVLRIAASALAATSLSIAWACSSSSSPAPAVPVCMPAATPPCPGGDASIVTDAAPIDDGDAASANDASATDAAVYDPSLPTVLVGPNGDHAFLPENLTVDAGTTVQWLWTSAGHSVVSGASATPDGLFCSPNDVSCDTAKVYGAGTIYRHTFVTPGTYPYFCPPHVAVGMFGSVVVQ